MTKQPWLERRICGYLNALTGPHLRAVSTTAGYITRDPLAGVTPSQRPPGAAPAPGS